MAQKTAKTLTKEISKVKTKLHQLKAAKDRLVGKTKKIVSKAKTRKTESKSKKPRAPQMNEAQRKATQEARDYAAKKKTTPKRKK